MTEECRGRRGEEDRWTISSLADGLRGESDRTSEFSPFISRQTEHTRPSSLSPSYCCCPQPSLSLFSPLRVDVFTLSSKETVLEEFSFIRGIYLYNLSISLSVYLSIDPPTDLSIHPSICLSVDLSIYRSNCQSIVACSSIVSRGSTLHVPR